MKIKHTDIHLMRHGEPEGGRKFRGALDDPLSKTGWQQMRSAVAERGGWDRIVSSPLLRCQRFAEELAGQRELDWSIDEDLREMHFGEWEGRTGEELMRAVPDQIVPFWKNPAENPPPGGETMQDFRERTLRAWSAVIENHREQSILVVCHGGVIRMLLSQALEMPLNLFSRFDVPYACLSHVRIWHAPDGDYPVLMAHEPAADAE